MREDGEFTLLLLVETEPKFTWLFCLWFLWTAFKTVRQTQQDGLFCIPQVWQPLPDKPCFPDLIRHPMWSQAGHLMDSGFPPRNKSTSLASWMASEDMHHFWASMGSMPSCGSNPGISGLAPVLLQHSTILVLWSCLWMVPSTPDSSSCLRTPEFMISIGF